MNAIKLIIKPKVFSLCSLPVRLRHQTGELCVKIKLSALAYLDFPQSLAGKCFTKKLCFGKLSTGRRILRFGE